jgi:hypothetical protein
MANITEDLLHGQINYTHTSTMTPYYPPGNIPTPWPVVLVSLLVSLTISCYGCKGAFAALSALTNGVSRVRDHSKSPWARKQESALHQTELEDLHKAKSFDPPPPYQSETSSSGDVESEMMSSAIVDEEQQEVRNGSAEDQQKWEESPRRKIVETACFIFSTFRSVVAFIINVK